MLAVVKRSGVTEPFSREKVISGVRRACQGRQVDDDALNLLAQQVEDAVRAAGSPEVPSNEVGLAILGPLRELDEVVELHSVAGEYDALAKVRCASARALEDVLYRIKAIPGVLRTTSTVVLNTEFER